MIFKRSLVYELFNTALSSFIVILGVMTAQRVTYYLGIAARGGIVSDMLGALLGLSVLRYLPLLLSLTLFIAVLVTLTRWHRDSEMVVWFTSGQGVYALIRPVLSFSLPIIVIIGLLSFLITPWATKKSEEFREQMESRNEVYNLSPGIFKESKHAERVYFIESFSTLQNKVNNIFAQSIQHGKLGIITAAQGSYSTDKSGDTLLTLYNGHRYEGVPNTSEFGVMQFEKYTIRTEPVEIKRNLRSTRSKSSKELLMEKTIENNAELQWRLSTPIYTFLLVLLAIPLSFVDPRAGRSVNVIMAILIFFIYTDTLSILQSWVVSGKITPVIGLWPAHFTILLLCFYMFYRRLFLLPLIPRWFAK